MTAERLSAALALVALLALPASAPAANIVINNINAAGVGFNDPTPVAPLPTNPGTTLGQQRLIVFERGAEILGDWLVSPVTIIVNAQFLAQTCGPTSGVLGSAGSAFVFRDFTNAPVAGTWFHSALAKSIAGTDLNGQHDLNANFNLNLDSDPNCLGGVGWYYGLDHNQGNQLDLLAVVLHEISHGLGFANFVDEANGTLFMGFPDIFAANTLDTSTGLLWTQMNNAERQASAINDPFVVWAGPAVTAKVLDLGVVPVLTVNSPAPIAGDYEAQGASFGPPVGSPVTADVALVDDGTGLPNEGCSPLINGGQINGRLALVDRGSCTFTAKVINAQNAGAVGVIVANNAAGLPPMGGSDPAVTIPSLGVSQATGNAIKAQLGGGVNASLRLDPGGTRAGTNNDMVRLHAPNPVAPGSSISHWTTATAPNLLMEPAISPDLTDSIDLTLEEFIDVFWETTLIFRDGFERGDAAGWSTSLP